MNEVQQWPLLDVNPEIASDTWNLGLGAFKRLDGFMGMEDFHARLYEKHLTTGVPWTIPLFLDVSTAQANGRGGDAGLWYAAQRP